MTLNDPERRNSRYFAFFTEFDCFAGQLKLDGPLIMNHSVDASTFHVV